MGRLTVSILCIAAGSAFLAIVTAGPNYIDLQRQSSGIAVLVDGKQVGLATSVNFISGNGVIQVCLLNGTRVDCTPSYNSAIIATKAALASGACTFLRSTNGSIAYTVSLVPSCGQALQTYGTGPYFLVTDVPCPANCFLNIDNVGIHSIKRGDGTTDPGGIVDFRKGAWIWFDGTVFRIVGT